MLLYIMIKLDGDWSQISFGIGLNKISFCLIFKNKTKINKSKCYIFNFLEGNNFIIIRLI